MRLHDLKLLATEDGSYTLYDPALDESYHSKFGARTESDQVFLRNAGVHRRLALKKSTSVLEIGFGTGYNFVHTAGKALEFNCCLDYTAIELHPLPAEIVLQLLSKNNTDEALSAFTAGALDQIASNTSNEQITFSQLIELCLVKADATQWHPEPERYDAIYLDAFSKKNNPALWEPSFLVDLKQSLNNEGTLATYCVNRSFREALSKTGWQWQKLPGPKGKREVLIARHSGID